MKTESIKSIPDSTKKSADASARDELWKLSCIDDAETLFRPLYAGLVAATKIFRHVFQQQEFNQLAVLSCLANLLGYEILLQSYCRKARLQPRKKIKELLARCSWEEDWEVQDILYDAGLFPNDFR